LAGGFAGDGLSALGQHARRCAEGLFARRTAQSLRAQRRGVLPRVNGSVTLREEPIANVGQLAGVAMVFMVDRVFDIATSGEKFGDFTLRERRLTRPYIKDYDALPHEGPANWAKQFDLSRWFFVSAWNDSRRIGGAVVACQTKGVDMLEGRD